MKKILAVLAALLVSGAALAQAAPSMTLTLQTTTGADKKSVVPSLTWATVPAATSCTASGGWSGTKTASGTLALPAVSVTTSYALLCNWPGVTKAVVTWTAPTTNVDGSPLTNLQGYRVQYGRTNTEAGLDTSVYTENLLTTWTSPDLAPGAWYFGIKAYNSLGLESALSNIATKTTTAAATDSRSLELAIKIPSPPTGVQ